MQLIEFLVAATTKATVILAAAFFATALLRRAPAAARYFLWTATLAAMLIVPAASLEVRPWNVPLATPAVATEFVDVEIGAHRPAQRDIPKAPKWLIPLWLCGAAIVLGRAAAGHWRVRRMIRSASPVRDYAWRSILAESAAAIGLRRAVDLRQSPATEVPIGYGWRLPVVLLPLQAEPWSEERRKVVLLHELTHIRRLDLLARVLEQVVCAAYWFHPLAWLAAGRFRGEQERSCDDAVIVAGIAQTDYAAHLVALAGSLSRSAIGMAERSGLEGRVRALLDPRRSRRPLSRAVCAVGIAGLIACAIPLAALRAQVNRPQASLSGTVYDPSGAVTPNAIVQLKNGKSEEMAHANASGVYHFENIPAGNYDLEVTAPGFQKFTRQALEISGNAAVDVHLTLGNINQTVEVMGRGTPAPTPADAAQVHAIEVGGRVQAAKLVWQIAPVYPPAAQAAGLEGAVVLHAIVSEEGALLLVAAASQSADPSLVQAAIDAVKQWRYQPTLLNGHPVKVATTITVNFRLQQ